MSKVEWKVWTSWWILFCIRYFRIFSVYLYNPVIDNPSIKIYVNKVEKRLTFKIKTEYYLKLLTRKTMKLLGGTKNKITKDG